MPTKRTRQTHERSAKVSDVALYYASDGLWADPPEAGVLDIMTYKYPTVRPDQCREVWLSIRDELLPEWIQVHPGTRPSWWYLFDPECPRMSEQEIERHGWTGWYFAKGLPDLRRRVGGIGDPAYEHAALTPSFDCAVPDRFVSKCGQFGGKPIDPRNPPQYESQATYLERHGLLQPAERRRLKPQDFEPELIVVEA